MTQTQTKADPRPALWTARARLVENITRQRRALVLLGCGCGHGTCRNDAAREQLLTLIHTNQARLDDLNDAIAQRPTC